MPSSTPLKVISNEFAEIEIYEDYLVSTFKEGLVFNHEHLEWFFQLTKDFYPNKQFGYISNRMHDYAINPVIYHTVSLKENILAVAIVCHNKERKEMALFEKTFYDKDFEVFSSVEDAVDWIKTIV